MALRVSTTGFDVPLDDLGIVIEHPTTNRDLFLEFTSDELKESEDLTLAIQNSDLLVDDGQFEINANDYNPNEVINQELFLKVDKRFISHDELSAGYLDTPIESGVFPLALNSTASVTKNIYVPAARWGTWQIDIGDLVVINGSTAADGTYTIDSISDHQNFIVVEPIADSTGGNITVYHPNAASRIGINDNDFQTVSGSNLQEVLDSVDDALGAGGFSDELVKVSANDTNAGYLNGKLVQGTNITFTENNDSGNETLTISASGGSSGLVGCLHQMSFVENYYANNKWLSYYDDSIISNETHAILPWKSELVGISFTNKQCGVDTDIKIWSVAEGDSCSPQNLDFMWELRNVRIARKTNLSNVIFDAGDKISIYLKDRGTNPRRVVVKLYFKILEDINEEAYENYCCHLGTGTGGTS